MSWVKHTEHPWHEPLHMAAAYAADDMALLYSGRKEASTGQQSFLLLAPQETIEGHRFAELPSVSGTEGLPYWVGYLGYGMRNDTEQLTRGSDSAIHLPDFRFIRYGRLFLFQHDQKIVTEYHAADYSRTSGLAHTEQTLTAAPSIASLQSNFTRARYERVISDTLEQIAEGRFYQANITRKFFGQFAETPEYFALYRTLCEASPAPYSAYIRSGDTAILSSSPELFIAVDTTGTITSRPIKGSAPRGNTPAEDQAIAQALVSSEKNQAENLMIVDLMRHDLSRVSEPKSVQVAEQSGLYSYATIHHLVSTITAQKRTDVSTHDVLRACFPPGSMTGAPKIAAMEWCTQQESMERGVYSGALGWFASDGSCDLSVVIRTLICQGDRFEFQVGGGIVADSTPTSEWRETLVKARGIAKALGVSEAQLEAL